MSETLLHHYPSCVLANLTSRLQYITSRYKKKTIYIIYTKNLNSIAGLEFCFIILSGMNIEISMLQHGAET